MKRTASKLMDNGPTNATRPFWKTNAVPDDSFWRSLRFFSYYRITVAGIFLAIIIFTEGAQNVGSQNPRLFFWVSTAYLIGGILAVVVLTRWQRLFNRQLTLQVGFDILALTLLMYASGGAKSGLPMLLFVVLMGAGLVGQGRLVLFYAALSSLAILLEQAYRVSWLAGDVGDFFRAGLTSVGFFGVAIAARLLASRVVANEELARRRGIELADQLRINERVIREMHDGVLVVGMDGHIALANPPAAVMLGRQGELPRSLAACSAELDREFRRRRERGIESETVVQMPQTGRSLRVRFLPPGEGGKTLIFIEDVGRQLQQAQQAKLAALGRLTANIAHEIRNPLSAISHAAELLQDDLADETRHETMRLVRIIGDNVARLNRIVEEIMELGRRDQARPEEIDLKDFLRQMIEELSLRDRLSESRIRLELPAGFAVCFDRSHLYRVLANLLDNALRHASDAPGAIRIVGESGRAPNRIALHVIDDGPGIGAEVRSQIFEPFYTTRATGTGLGLYIARELCEANGARLFLLDNAPGAHFCISFAAACNTENHDPLAE
ncbi:MAG: HAMP domain-containing histidine kinase [Rhodocyclaceae bacterium]|nr:HAMP domain-containing histidine kinase [Rhodocyclaceae bacterium]